MRVFPNIAATVKVRKRLRIASGSQPPSGSVSINLHENNRDIVDRAAIQRNFQQAIARLG
jgi:hypothetical protein